MIQIILASHGDFCLGIKQTVEMIAGSVDNLKTISFRPGQSPEDYAEKFSQILEDTSKQPALVLVDLKGGTPFNTAMLLKKNHNLEIVTGVNVPMLLSIVTLRTKNSSIEELINVALAKENWGIENTKLGGLHHAKLSLNKN